MTAPLSRAEGRGHPHLRLHRVGKHWGCLACSTHHHLSRSLTSPTNPSSQDRHQHTHTPSWQFHFKQRPIGWAGETSTWGCQGTKLVNLLAFVCCKACVCVWGGLLGRVGDEGYIWQGGEGETRGLQAPARPKVSKGTRRTGLRAMATG